ncbi:MAG: DUF960 domain-containing protein [Sarcina sp.]
MFNGDKYITRGINEKLDVRLQIMLWEMIELLRKKNIELDYLQIFRISNTDGKIIIEHMQEVPEYRVEYSLELKDIKFESNDRIYVIDSEIYSTMLLAEEY